MSNLIPYFVLAVVALGFFAVCYAVFSGGDGESKAKEKSYKNISNKNNPKAHNDVIFATESQEGNVTITHTSGTNVYTASIPDTVETVVGEEREPAESLVDPIDTSYNRRSTLKSNSSHVSEGEYALALGSDNGTPIGSDNGTSIGDETIVMTAVSDLKQANKANQGVTPLVDKTIVLDVVTDELLNNANSVEDTIAMGESMEAFEADEADSIDATQMIGGANEIQTAEGPSVLDETRLFDASEIEAQLAATSLTEEEEPHGQWAKAAHEDKCVELAIAPFVHSFGVLHGDTQHYVESITRDALAALNITKIVEVNALLENIVIQEALMSMQKAYAATNTEWMKSAALGAFLDVVQSPKSSTPYLVAFDALRVLPHLTLGHFQVMALTLLLQYSRNSNNYGLIHFQHYVEKYIEPFISDLPRNDSFYRQLDYLRCTQEEQEPITLCQVLSNSYPFVFNYRGFSKEELFHATDGHGVDPRYVVRSLNSNLYKLALVDESLASQFFRQTRISNAMVQRDLLALMKSKPTAFRGQEARDIMDDISPVLLDLADIFDRTPMSKISLTLLGLYLGRAHVKATIGEEFDLSHWF
ncbi:MAG: hypothetical protein KH224_06705 [Veillonella parvula]|uniref:LPO_1073/Vpar_1526 family protein n=1 Tax=Veillonella parvula TaxID=29466 RepID=UPI001D731DE1|nr:LPO_1073/Vpar_1526 family protein [Veillonella parvula]MBS6748237.1 hypothetical protein [Veillonella parvula]